MINRIVKMTFREDYLPIFLAIFEQNKKAIRNQPGCTYLELWQDESNPCIMTTFSKWDSEADLNNYRGSKLFKEVWKQTKLGFSSSPNANSYKTVAQLF